MVRFIQVTKGTSERDRGGKKERFQRAVKLISRGTLVCIYITCGSKEMEGKKKNGREANV